VHAFARQRLGAAAAEPLAGGAHDRAAAVDAEVHGQAAAGSTVLRRAFTTVAIATR
jgi:hypothetical protein